MNPPLLRVCDVSVHYPTEHTLLGRPRAWLKAVDGVSFSLGKGETLALVGESGCGKTTLGKAILGLVKPKQGEIYFEQARIWELSRRAMRHCRARMQCIFQDPADSLNSRHTVREILEEPWILHRKASSAQRLKHVEELLDQVGLARESLDKYPFEFSGGQRQRIGIARAISLEPALIICDEPVSALDVSIQGQILNLLLELQQRLQMSYLFISHNLAVVDHIADRVAVMQAGKIVEMGATADIFGRPQHAFTKRLLAAIAAF